MLYEIKEIEKTCILEPKNEQINNTEVQRRSDET